MSRASYPRVTSTCTNRHTGGARSALSAAKGSPDKEFAMTARAVAMFAIVAGVAVFPACSSAPAESTNTVKLQGAGASFPAPLYTKWFKSYTTAHQNVLVDYQSVGSGSGVKSVIDHTVDFGASDEIGRAS